MMDRSELNKAIERAVGGEYTLPDGRSFWIDRTAALEITDRVAKALVGFEFRAGASADDVLGAFSVEPNPDKAALTVYLKKYPQHALDLVDLFIELHRTIPEDTGEPLSPEEEAIIDAAWRAHAVARPAKTE